MWMFKASRSVFDERWPYNDFFCVHSKLFTKDTVICHLQQVY